MPASQSEQVFIVAPDDELTAGIIEASVRDAGYPVLRALHGAHALEIIDEYKMRFATA